MATMSARDRERIRKLKEQYANATSQAEKDTAHARAEGIRSKYGYSGGVAGDERIPIENKSSRKTIPIHMKGSRLDKEDSNERPERRYDDIMDDVNDRIEDLMKSQEERAREQQRRAERLAELQRQQRINQIEKSRQKALGILDEEESRIEPAFDAQRRGVRSSGRESARTLEEYLAQRGLQNSGAMAEGQMRQAQTTRSGLSQLGQQQAQVESDIARRRSDVRQGALQDMNMAELQAQQQQIQSALAMGQQQSQFEQQLGLQGLGYSQQLAMNNLNYEQQRQMKEMSNQQQMDYLERQNQLMVERERGNMTPLQFYEEKLKLQQQYAPKSSAGSYSDSDIRQYSMVGSAIDNRIRDNDYLGAYKVYEANRDLAQQLLSKNKIDYFEQYGEGLREAKGDPGGREIR